MMLFRTYKYTVQCDIRHMYRMIAMHPEHRRLQNILWRADDTLQCLQLQTITYGLKSSAYLATKCLVELAKKYKAQFPLASEAIIKNSYVDDVQGGSDTLQGALQLKSELISLMSKGSFQLHKWISNNTEILQDIPQEKIGLTKRDIDQDKSIVKILGLSYDAREDAYKMSGRVLTSPEVPTKRNVLSSVSRLYDPMGFVGPLTVKAKLILQQIWQYDLEWDSPLPPELVKIWQTFYNNLISMPNMTIPRYINLSEASSVQLIGYCDASVAAYGCCIYIKAVVNGKPYIHLLCSKSRIAPLSSKLTIPKLELNGALLLAKLVNHVAALLSISDVHLFSDSKIVLAWLDSSSLKVPAYIGNRVKEINKLTDTMSWKYTPGLLNPSDILSRGADPQEIINCRLWRHGPDYLTEGNEYNFHVSEISPPLCSIELPSSDEHVALSATVNDNVIDPFFERFSSLFRMIRVTVYTLRFINKCKGKSGSSNLISVKEYRDALTLIIKCVQRHYFHNELSCIEKDKAITSNLKSLTPFIDSAGLLRVGGRLDNATHLDFSYLTPGHFLIGTELTSVPQPDLTAVPSNRLRFWRCCEQMRQHFWSVWSKEYLSSLNQRTKWQKTEPNLKVGMMVLLQVPNTPPLTWPLGRVSKVFYGNDGNVRVVEVQTSDKKLHSRAVSKIVVLPIEA
ncbi:uncharacterized protein LOC125242543 isoform X1 [Leguminivora glycinivorella]|uniref:uncharacterized protein LOC125230460 isoform X1 n=2 Tax=Leguminivora glycinivorella TaxID=1035111 RepID=UPI00200BC000|nr:uncharacterized protein LOC125230460 isoform X1 [Leguminivora glycinivorella]XP_048007253.1 uncharacterized protein LOC125242543 isoform X1 [Leguminivora glycinivorella]